MKKKVSLLLLALSIVVYIGYSYYTVGSFDYNFAQFIGYIFYWCVTLFIVSLMAFTVDSRRYKTLSLITLVYVFISILIAYETGDGGSGIVSFYGKDLFLFFAGLYLFISIIYFIVQYFKNRSKPAI